MRHRLRRRLARTVLVLGALLGAARGMAAQPAGREAGEKRAEGPPRRARPLFASDSVLRLTLVADYRALAGDRDTLQVRLRPATLLVEGDGGAVRTVPVQLNTRGHFRLRSTSCGFPPLRVSFDKGTRDTPFAGQRGLKLVTHCQDRSDVYEQYVLREYLAYRVHQALTPHSFRARLARVRYVPLRDGVADSAHAMERWAFLLESEREMAQRVGGRVLETMRGATFADAAPDSGVSVALFEYLIGNTDWSLSYLHNVRLVGSTDGALHAVPYDFDYSGLVSTRYAVPDPVLPIRSVQERLWRGPCASPAALQAALAPFVAARERILALPASIPSLDAKYAEQATRYLREFYELAEDVPRFARSTRPRAGCPTTN
jgi:hypothetical protein